MADAGDIIKGFADGNVGSTDYTYDVKGNMTVDKNKGITAITYTHQNLPLQVTKGTGETAKFSYDANGIKLSESFYNSAGTLTKQIDYVGEYFYQNDSLKQISHAEGRVVMTGTSPEYQYFLRDRWGNNRVTFTSKDETEVATATNEPVNATAEQGKYLRYTSAKFVNSSIFDRTNGSAPSMTTGYAQRLNGSANEKYGLARSISVMPGDIVKAEVYAKYVDPNTSNWNGTLTTLMNQIASGTAGVVVDGANYSTSTSTFPAAYPNLVTKSDNGAPKAYLNWLVFDRDYNFINGGFQQISTACRETGTDVAHERLASPSITIAQPGYVYIYVSNDNATQVEVFFDDINVTQIKSPVVQTNDYYPFGLTFNSYSRENSIPQKYLYNGKELQTDLGLNWEDYGARMYMPEIGRWGVVDPLSEKMSNWSPYVYAFNNPVRFIDRDGRQGEDPNVERLNNLAVTFDKQMSQMWTNSFPSGDNSKVEEWNGTLATNTRTGEVKLMNIHTNHESGKSNVDKNLPDGFVYSGDVHTHPYSKTEGAKYNAAFSRGDIDGMRSDAGKKNFTSFVESGERRFALVVIDPKKASDFFKNNDQKTIYKKYGDALSKSIMEGKSFSQAVSDAVRAVVGKSNVSGIGFYRTNDRQKQKFIQTNQ